MTLTRNNLIVSINQIGFTQKKSTEIVETIIELMKNTLGSGDDLLISGFGKLCVKAKESRVGRNPYTGESLELEGRRVVTFKCSGKLRDRIQKG